LALCSTDASGALTGWNINILGGIFSGTNSPPRLRVALSCYSVLSPCCCRGERTAAPPALRTVAHRHIERESL
jgi:hypothetical protein